MWFTLLPSGAFEIDFIWNQDEEDVLLHLEQTRGLERSKRSDYLSALKLAQAERRSSALYDTLVREVVKLIPEEWATASVTLTEAGIGILKHQAHYRGPTQEDDDQLNVTYSWSVLLAIEELRQLKKAGGHPDWQEVTFYIEADGTYRAEFVNNVATPERLAGDYYYDGVWLPPATGASALPS